MLSKFFINRPIFAWVIAIVIMMAGALAISGLPVSMYPTIAPPSVSIRATYSGASAETVSNTVTQIIEQNMTGLDGYMYMSSESDSNGDAHVTITFEAGTDPDIAQVQVQNKLQQATTQLPQEVQQYGITVEKSTSSFLMAVALISPNNKYESGDLADYVVSNFKEPISRLDGIGDIIVFGGQYSMRVWLNPDKLSLYGISTDEVNAAIKAQNAQVTYGALGGAPSVEAQKYNFTIVGQSRLNTPEQFRNIVLRGDADGHVIRLKDVARVEMGNDNEEYSTTLLVDHKNASGLGIMLSTGANALQTSRLVRAKMAEFEKTLPDGMAIVYPFDTTPFITVSINSVTHTLYEAILLVFIIMYLFLQNLRATLIPTIAVPVVLLGTFAIMYAAGFSINTLTMFGLVLAIGLLVDDAIVVVENVERVMTTENLTGREATIKSMDEITGALIGIAMVLSAVFIPMAFFGGSTGVIYRQFSITIVSAMGLSVFIALTLTPSLCASMLRGKKDEELAAIEEAEEEAADPRLIEKRKKGALRKAFEKITDLLLSPIFNLFNRFFTWMTESYENHVREVVHHLPRYFLYYACICGVLVWGFMKLPSSFLPEEDQGTMFTMITLPAGGTIEQNRKIAGMVTDLMREGHEDVIEQVMAVIGWSYSGVGQNNSMFFVKLKDWSEREGYEKTVYNLIKETSPKLGAVRDALAYCFNIPAIPELGTAQGFDMFLEDRGGYGHEELIKARNKILAASRNSEIIENVRANGLDDTPQLRINTDYQKAAALGVTASAINSTMSTAWGSSYTDDFVDRGRVKKVMVQADKQFRSRELDLNKWYVPNTKGEMVPFSAFATKEWTYGSPRLERFNAFPAVEITGQPKTGHSTGEAMDEIVRLAKQLPNGYEVEWTGTSFQEKQSGDQAPFLYAISLVVVFLSLAALYESWSIPFAVMLVVPLGVCGSVIAAMITQWWAQFVNPNIHPVYNDVYFQVGLLTTIGLSAKNAILIVEFAKDIYDSGAKLTDAVVKAARIRLRPILMTSLAFIFGVLPLALSSGAGSNSHNEIGICVIGGMLSATLLAIVFVPVFFVFVMRYCTKYIPKQVREAHAKKLAAKTGGIQNV